MCNQLKTSNWSTVNLKKKTCDHNGSTPEPTIWSRDTGQGKPCFDSCQLTTAWMCNNRLEAQIRLPHQLESLTLNFGDPGVQTDGWVKPTYHHVFTQISQMDRLPWGSVHMREVRTWNYAKMTLICSPEDCIKEDTNLIIISLNKIFTCFVIFSL